MTDDKLRSLGRELPWDRPDAARREAVRASLLLAFEDAPPRRGHRGVVITAGAFAAGALAAAAIALVVVHRDPPARSPLRAQINASSAAELEHTVTATATGSDEVVRVHGGTVRIAAPVTPAADHVRVQTRDAAVEGAGEYEVVVAHDLLASVTVHAGTARISVTGHAQPVFLATGETWHAAVITADVVLPGPGSASAAHAPPAAPGESPDPAAIAPGAPHAPPAGAIGSPDPHVAAAMRDPLTAPATHAPRAGTNGSQDPHGATMRELLTHPAMPVPRDGAAAPPAVSAAGAAPSGVRVERLTVTRPGPSIGPVRSTPRLEPPRVDPSKVAPASPAPPTAAPLALANTDRPAISATTRAGSPIERHFQAGWALLRAGKPREAALELGQAADASDRDPLAIDARYFQAVALIRAGATRDAEKVLLAFLDHAPGALRRGRASVMLARLIAGRGDPRSARAWFESALRDPDPEIAAAARIGLDALPAPPAP